MKQMLYRLIEEGINKDNETVFKELLADDFESHGFHVAAGPNGYSDITKQFKILLPNFKVIIKDTVIEGNKIASRGTVSGTHTGQFSDITPTGKQVSFPYMDLWRVENGKFVEGWTVLDVLKLLQELGLVALPESEFPQD